MNKKLFILKMLIVIFMLLLGIYYYPILPSTMPIHWNYMWVADNFASKEKAIFIFPWIAFILLLLLQILPKLDPKKENYPKFEKAWEAFQFALLIFFLYAYSLTIFATLYTINMWQYMMFWLWILFMVLGNYMWKIRRNYFVGIRLPWTIDNEDVWNKTHRLWWKMFMLAGFLFLVNAFLNFNPAMVIIPIIFLILFFPIVYSYIIFKRLTVKK